MKKLFGTRIKALRRQAGLTQAELAAQAGISDRFLGRLERGLSAPSFESLGQLARTLGVDPGELFTPAEEADAAKRGGRPPVKGRPSQPTLVEAAPAQPPVPEAMAQASILRDFSGMTLKCVDQDLRLLWVLSSDPALKDFQHSGLSRACYSQIHGLEAPCPGCLLPEAVRTGQPQGGEVTTPEGRTFITRSTPVPSPDGGSAWAVHMAFEITERKHMEEALRRTQARLEHLLASSPMVLRTCSPDDPFSPTYVSENIRDIFGFSQLDLLSSSFWISQVHPADAERVRRAQVGLAGRGRLVQDYRVRNREGVWRWVRDDQRLVTDCEGRQLEIVGAWQDITDAKASEIVLRSSESRYRDLFLTNSTVQLLIDGDTGGILDANPAAQAFYGYTSGELRSMNIADINTLELPVLGLRLREASSARARVFRFRHKLASGAVRDVEVRVSPLVQGRRVVLHSLIFDVTDSQTAMQTVKPGRDCEALLAMTSDMAAVLDSGEKLLACNEPLARALGAMREALRGAPCPPQLQGVLRHCQQREAESGPADAPWLQCAFAGRVVLARTSTISGRGQPDKIVLVLRDSPGLPAGR
ncbi:PAS domain S-box protein [Fundidesulfovibrio agrisoli]|uniref:PAS domain S-box protein n=1 Tax=Fundidesulfovibrio agrisoli TaxID=2922717 RepID=UPI001FABF592|nr:PAS domain S-box protein [Fundidesulfovibrio agrisoli]